MNASWSQARVLASSVWVPWVLGVLSLLTLAVGAGVYGGRVDEGLVVPTAVLDNQQSTTGIAAQQVRRSLNTGLSDVNQLAGGLALANRPEQFGKPVREFTERFRRYRSVYVLDASRTVVARAGAAPHPRLLPAQLPAAGMTGAAEADRVPVVVQYATLKLEDKRTFIAVAEYDVAFLRHTLFGARPTTVWVVDRGGKVVASTAGFTAFQQLEDADLRQAASAAYAGSGVVTVGGSQAERDVVAYAPVHGTGLASSLSWGVVTARSVNTVSLPQTQAHRQAVVFATILGALAVGFFGWLLVLFLHPLRRLVAEAERLAAGDLDTPVEVRRLDEIGLVGRSLERVRVQMIKARVEQEL